VCAGCEHGRAADCVPEGWTRSPTKGTLSKKLRIGTLSIFRIPGGSDQSLDWFGICLTRAGRGSPKPEILSELLPFEFQALAKASRLVKKYGGSTL
jgi:hypothetical protein